MRGAIAAGLTFLALVPCGLGPPPVKKDDKKLPVKKDDKKPPVKKEEPKLDPALARYLTKDGQLTGALELRDEYAGFGAFAGRIVKVGPDGQWATFKVFR